MVKHVPTLGSTDVSHATRRQHNINNWILWLVISLKPKTGTLMSSLSRWRKPLCSVHPQPTLHSLHFIVYAYFTHWSDCVVLITQKKGENSTFNIWAPNMKKHRWFSRDCCANNSLNILQLTVTLDVWAEALCMCSKACGGFIVPSHVEWRCGAIFREVWMGVTVQRWQRSVAFHVFCHLEADDWHAYPGKAAGGKRPFF